MAIPLESGEVGAGWEADGQLMICSDVLGIFQAFTPKFVKKYADFHTAMQNAFVNYLEDVQAKTFPAEEHSVDIAEDEWQALLKEI